MALRFGEMVLIIRTQDFASRNLDRISSNLGKLSKVEELSRRRSVLAAREARKISRISDIRADLQKLQAQRQLSGAMNAGAAATANYADKQRRLTSALSANERELRIIQNDLVQVAKAQQLIKYEKLHRLGQTMSRTGRVMQLGGLIATGSFVAMGNAAANFGEQATLAATQARDIGAPIAQVATRSAQLQDFILNQMQKFPTSADDMANAAYEIFSSLDLADKGRIKFWKGLQILEKTNKVAVAGGVDLSDAIKGIIIMLNNFDPSLKHVNSTLDTMFDIVRFGNIRVADFTTLITRVAATAKGVGHTLDDLAAPIAFLTRVLPAERVGTGLFRLEEMFANRDFQQGIKILSKARLGKALDIGADSANAKNGDRLLVMVQDLAKVFPELTAGKADLARVLKLISGAGRTARTGRPSEGQVFTAQARNVLRPLLQNMGSVEELQSQILLNQGEFNRAFQAMRDTPAVQWKIFLNTLKAVAIEIGQDALPALLGLAGLIRGAINWWRGLNDGTKETIVRLMVFASVATLVGGVILSVAGGIISLVGAVAILSGGLGTVGGAGLLGRLALMLTFLRALSLVGVITIAVKIVLTKTGLDKWLRKIDEFQEKVTSPIPVVRDLFKAQTKFHEMIGFIPKESDNVTKKVKKNKNDALNWNKLQRNAVNQTRDEWIKANSDVSGSLDQLEKKYGNSGDSARQNAEKQAQAAQLMKSKVTEAVDGMMRLYDNFKQQNESALGSLFQGPQMQGIFGNVFTQLNSTLRQFGIQIPIPFNILRKDMDQQLMYFKRWRKDLNKLMGRGAPLEFIQELQQMGPEAGIPIAEGLLQGGRKGFKSLVAEWKKGQKLVDQATQTDMDRQLKDWERHGKDVVLALIRGIISEPSQQALRDTYKKYIIGTFGDILGSEVASEVQNSFTSAMSGIDIPSMVSDSLSSAGKTGKGGKGGKKGMPFVTPAQVAATRRAMLSRGTAWRALGHWAVDPRSLGGELITGKEQRGIETLQDQQVRLMRRFQAQRTALQRERRSVMAQLKGQYRYHPGGMNYTVSYGGDTVTIHADGATPQAVTRAINKLAFQKKHKHKRKP